MYLHLARNSGLEVPLAIRTVEYVNETRDGDCAVTTSILDDNGRRVIVFSTTPYIEVREQLRAYADRAKLDADLKMAQASDNLNERIVR